MKIKINWEVDLDNSSEFVNLIDLGLSEKEWNDLSDREKSSKLQWYLDLLPERVSLVLKSYSYNS